MSSCGGSWARFEASDLRSLFLERKASAAITTASAPFFLVECVVIRDDVGRDSYRGLEGLRAAWLDWLEPWESYHTHVEELIDLDDARVLVITHGHAQPRGASGEVEFRGASLWTFREGKIASVEFYLDRDQALAAAGLE